MLVLVASEGHYTVAPETQSRVLGRVMGNYDRIAFVSQLFHYEQEFVFGEDDLRVRV